jgi:hypothetical protein
MGVPECRLEDDYSKDLDNSVYNCVQETIKDRPYAFHHVEFLEEGKSRAAQRGWTALEELPQWAFKQN